MKRGPTPDDFRSARQNGAGKRDLTVSKGRVVDDRTEHDDRAKTDGRTRTDDGETGNCRESDNRTETGDSSASADDETVVDKLVSAPAAILDGRAIERVLETVPMAIVVVDTDGNITYANERAVDTLGLPRDDLTARRYDQPEWKIFADDGSPISVEDHPVTQVLETGDAVYGFEHWIERPDGTERWLSSNSAPLLDDDGAVEAVVVSFEDVKHLKRREERLTSDHVRLVEFRVDRDAAPPSLRIADTSVRIDVESVVSLPDGSCVQYMGTDDLSTSDFVAGVEGVPHYLDARLLATVDGYTRIEAHANGPTVSAVFPELGGRAVAVVIAPEGVRFLGELPGDVDPRLAADGIRRFHPEVELVDQELVYSPHLLYDVVADALTDRQFAAVEAAYYGGYFDSPRASTGGDLADRFGVTRQTYNQHLRKAERTVFQHLFEKSGAAAR